MAIACEVTGSPDCNVLGICAGGITTSLTLGHLAAIGDKRVNAGTLLVTMLDTSLPSMTGMFATEEIVADAIERSRKKGVLAGEDMARVFAWLRPNDLVWNYWVNNYLMGEQPPVFDILYWNGDSTNLPARLHEGFLNLFLDNPLAKPGTIEILGTPIDLRKIKSDMYLLAGQTDHICTWHSCYRATDLFGGKVEFVLNSSGHVQSLVSPPGNLKSHSLSPMRDWQMIPIYGSVVRPIIAAPGGITGSSGSARAPAKNARRQARWEILGIRRLAPRPAPTSSSTTDTPLTLLGCH